ncbi:hypothetical protein KAX75_08575, partial [candidate division WOR-3 bacterium]|nr:hypothetical protein [candidate division WOR-3 bacterium]
MKGKIVFIVLLFIFVTITYGYSYIDSSHVSRINPLMAERPNTQYKYHDVGNIWITSTNFGFFGNCGNWKIDGVNFPSCEFPGGSHADYLFQGVLWIGAIIQ